MAVANGDIFEVVFHHHTNQQRGLIRRYYQVANVTGTGPTDAEIGIRFDTAFPPLLKALMATVGIYKGVKIAKVFPGLRQRGFVNTTSTGAGTVVGDLLPTQVRGIVTLRTAQAGPGFRGRAYMPFPCEADNSPLGVPIAGYVTRLTTLGAQLILTQAAVGAAGNQCNLVPIIWHLPKDTPNLPINRQPFPLIEAVARTRWATQRRSGEYGRINVDEIV
jgi:hypothetical protein